jgi:two-component system phosphate regulon sensor histidine kinase PhoR
MPEISPKQLAFILAVILSLMATVTFSLITGLNTNLYFWVLISGTFLLLVIIQYIILSYSLEKFIYSRIKLIYKSIHRQKLSKDDKKNQILSIHGDIISKVNQEVEKLK